MAQPRGDYATNAELIAAVGNRGVSPTVCGTTPAIGILSLDTLDQGFSIRLVKPRSTSRE